MKSTNSMYEQPKKLPKGRSVSQTKAAPKIKGIAGFARTPGKVGGRVTSGGSKT